MNGQELALDQIRRIANLKSSPLEIVDVGSPPAAGAPRSIDVSLDCTPYERRLGGLRLHDRECVSIAIPVDFPYRPPAAGTAHTRFRGFPHVQWGRHLCLYQSPDTQWSPSEGMFGFFAKLDEWLRRAARNELDLLDGPLHPPVTYARSRTAVWVSVDAPTARSGPWFGCAVLSVAKPRLLRVTAWRRFEEAPSDSLLAPAVLLNFELPFEFPGTVSELLAHLDAGGGWGRLLLVYLLEASMRVPAGKPLHVAIGTPSRGLAGDLGQRRQHLAFWEIAACEVAALHEASLARNPSHLHAKDRRVPEVQAAIDRAWSSLAGWRRGAQVRWCTVMEDRPEIVTRRDEGTPMDWFRGKSVAIWGCGAIGSLVAEHLARAGAARLVLFDRSHVHPGILVRQNYSVADIGDSKPDALKRRLAAVNPSVRVDDRQEDVVCKTLNRPDWDEGLDLVIDATASLGVRSKLESVLKHHNRRAAVASVMINSTGRLAVATVAPAGYGAGPLDLLRRVGLAALSRTWLRPWTDAFWAQDGPQGLRQPEPGCSDPTFVASHADVAALAARALVRSAEALADLGDDAQGILTALDPGQGEHGFRFHPDIRWVADGIDFRLSAHSWRDIAGWIRAGSRERSPKHETGGLLFGDFDEALGIAWVTHVSGPPSDSSFSPERFVCGTDGTRSLCDEYPRRTRGLARYIGTWHSHPVGVAEPSETDHEAVRKLLGRESDGPQHHLMLIVGDSATPSPQLGAYLFGYASADASAGPQVESRGGTVEPPPVAALGKRIGLALSGGGSRAVAFHLGTLRALEDLALLDEVEVISGVSGGSVMAGLLGYSHEPFRCIDEKTAGLLRRGLVRPAVKRLLHPGRAVRFAWTLATGAVMCGAGLAASGMARVLAMLSKRRLARFRAALRSRSVRRRCTGIHLVADAFAGIVGAHACDTPTRQSKSIVFNACELRTGTAFRMSNELFGSYRYGWAPASEIRVADAVAASAAHPAYLSPMDWTQIFEKGGEKSEERVIVTDGGVYENLGVTVMEPGRNREFSRISYNPEVVIVSDAGAGQFVGDDVPVCWPRRMIKVADSLIRRVQDATKKRLHNHARFGRISKFVYASLGQIDSRVPYKAPNWVDRDQVIQYSTDFSAMSAKDIRLLAARGEAVTRALVTQYLLAD